MSTLLEPKLKDFARFFDKNDKIRLHHVRNEAQNRLITHEELCDVYSEWVSQDEYLVLAKPGSRKFVAVKCSKRGNDVYKFRIENRFKELDALAEILGDDRIFDINQQNPKTNVLFLTLTYDTKLCNESEAWKKVGKQFNSYISFIKRKFGPVSFVRAWEGFANGYPHVHMVIIFKNKFYKSPLQHESDVPEFNVFEQQESENKTVYRIQEKYQFEFKDDDSRAWHSWVDVQAVSSLGGAIRYITKYLRKTHGYEAKTNLTQAQMWVNRKQSFSISKDFVEQTRLVYGNLRNSNKKLEQLDLFGESIEEKWQLVGIYSKEELNYLIKNDSASWNLELSSLDGLEIKEVR